MKFSCISLFISISCAHLYLPIFTNMAYDYDYDYDLDNDFEHYGNCIREQIFHNCESIVEGRGPKNVAIFKRRVRNGQNDVYANIEVIDEVPVGSGNNGSIPSSGTGGGAGRAAIAVG